MKTTLTILFIFFLSSLFTDTTTNHQNIIPVSLDKPSYSMSEIELRYLNSCIKLTRCKILLLQNQHDINMLIQENNSYGKSWDDIEQELYLTTEADSSTKQTKVK